MTLYPWGAKPGPWRTSPRDGVLLGWAGTTFATYATAREAEAPEKDGGLKRRSGAPSEAASTPTRRTYARGALACRLAYAPREPCGLDGRKLPVKSSRHSPPGRV